MKRKDFITTTLLAALGATFSKRKQPILNINKKDPILSKFEKSLSPVGRALEFEDYYVWCNSPIEGPDGKIHVFYSRWPKAKSMSGWTNSSEIAHAVADKPEGPYKHVSTILAPRGEGFWDATTCHNPSIHFVDGKYALFFMGNSNRKLNTQRVGLATADSLYGPWTRPDEPLLNPGETGQWDDHCTTNPSFLKHPNGEYWMYYKSFDTEGYVNPKFKVRGNRKYGLAIAQSLQGPYIKYKGNPVIDYHKMGNNQQCEDAFVWYDGKFKMLARDLGVYGLNKGLYMESDDGIVWSTPQIAYQELSKYVTQPPKPKHLSKYGRAERPQVLFQNGKPSYLFTASQGGKYETASGFIFKIN